MNDTNNAPKLLRMKQIRAQYPLPPSTLYDHVKKSLFPKPIKCGERISAWISDEVTAVISARIAGKSEAEIKALVLSLENQRVANWG